MCAILQLGGFRGPSWTVRKGADGHSRVVCHQQRIHIDLAGLRAGGAWPVHNPPIEEVRCIGLPMGAIAIANIAICMAPGGAPAHTRAPFVLSLHHRRHCLRADPHSNPGLRDCHRPLMDFCQPDTEVQRHATEFRGPSKDCATSDGIQSRAKVEGRGLTGSEGGRLCNGRSAEPSDRCDSGKTAWRRSERLVLLKSWEQARRMACSMEVDLPSDCRRASETVCRLQPPVCCWW